VLAIALAVFQLTMPVRKQQLRASLGLRRGVWIALTTAAFVTGNFWVFCAAAAGLLLWARGREENGPALFLALLFVVPPAQLDIPGFGMVNFFFSLNLPRLLSLTLLLPLAVRLAQQHRPFHGGGRLADFLFAGYVTVQLMLLAREPSVTSATRSVFYLVVDIVLPYYVFSRWLDDVRKFRDAAAAFVVAGAVLAAIALFETLRHWLVYSGLVDSWGSPDRLLYLGRQGALRAMASTGHSIALGYVMALALLFYLPLRERLARGWQRKAMLVLLVAGLVAPLSRGPWLGAAAGFLLYLLLGDRPVRNLSLAAAAGLGALGLLLLLPGGQAVIGVIPFIGDVDAGNIEYRKHLMDSASQLIWDNPLLGLPDYIQQLARMGLVQGQGIVDIVNTYLQVALRSGLVGLAFFAGVMGAALLATVRARKWTQRGAVDDAADLGRSLAAAQLAVIVTIGSVSSVWVIPWVYWCLAGMLVAFARAVHASAWEPQAEANALQAA
jgi:hypothetical protein